jgi:hypothetical protein
VLELDLDRRVVHHLGGLVVGHQRDGVGVVGGVLLVGRTIERELDGVGVEGRAVVELHALAQLEGVGQAIVRHVPGLGQARLDGVVAGVLVDQRVVDGIGDDVAVGQDAHGRVERRRVRRLGGREGQLEHPAGLRAG